MSNHVLTPDKYKRGTAALTDTTVQMDQTLSSMHDFDI